MAYVVLARKFRPQTLSEVIGQDAVVQTLRNAIKLRRIHHAYLFTGARGVGKTSIARILAKSLNCEQGPTDTPCGQCASCQEIARSSSQDVLEIDGASNTSVDDVRDLRETVKYLPSRGKHKIYIIDEVHMLSTSAFNALLKTLEEPPEHVIFVFATTEPHKIPITILSRCQRFDFRRVPTPILAERLTWVAEQESVKINKEAVHLIAKAADGSVRDSMSLLDQVIAFSGNEIAVEQAQRALGLLDREKVRSLLQGLLARDRTTVSRLVQDAFLSGADLGEISERLVEAVRDLALAKMTNGQSETLSDLMPEEVQSLTQAAGAMSPADLHRLFGCIVKAAEDTAKSPFPHLSFEMGLLRACDLEPVATIADLVNQLRGAKPTGPGGPGATQGVPGGAATAAAAHITSVADQPPPAPRALQIVAPAHASGTFAMQTQETAHGGSALAVQQQATQVEAAPKLVVVAPPTDYKSFTAQVIPIKPRIGAALENVACEGFGPTVLKLSVPAGNEVFGDMLMEPETQAFLQDITQKLLGQRMTLDIVRGAAAGPIKTLADERRSERQDEVKRLRVQGAENPAVRLVLQTLGGEIRNVQVRQALSHAAEEYD